MNYPNLFKSRYPELKGKNWIKTVSAEDLRAFVMIGFTASNYGRTGGIIRGKFGKRDARGRFVKVQNLDS